MHDYVNLRVSWGRLQPCKLIRDIYQHEDQRIRACQAPALPCQCDSEAQRTFLLMMM